MGIMDRKAHNHYRPSYEAQVGNSSNKEATKAPILLSKSENTSATNKYAARRRAASARWCFNMSLRKRCFVTMA